MSTQRIPAFEGTVPEGTTVSFTGKMKDEGKKPDRAFRLDEESYLVVRVATAGVTHDTKDGIVTRHHKFKVLEAHEVGTEMADELLGIASGDIPNV